MKYIWAILLIFFSIQIKAQENSNIVQSFDSLVLNSNSWKQFRVIKKVELEAFKKELSSSTEDLKSEIISLNDKISSLEKNLSSFEDENKALNAELTEMKNAKDEMNLLGITLSKSAYTILVWSIILVLILVLSFVIFKLRNNNIVVQEIKENLENTTKEFEEYKHRAIEKQQKLGRELLDAQKLAQGKNLKK